VDALERRADEEAADWLIPKDQMDSFILRAKPFYTQDSVVRFASRMGVHPSIVIGQLQHRRVIGWDKHSSLKPKILEHLLSTTMSDGYLRQK
jgi:HTH-type transcriptional regulator/antitoxin HigA